MRRLTLAVLFMMALAGSAFAHNGALSLYVDQTIADCDLAIDPFVETVIQLFYVRGQGPEMGIAAEMKFVLSDAGAIFTKAPTWSSQIVVSMGNETDGYTISGGACLGVGLDVVYLGDVYVFSFGVANFTCRVISQVTNEFQTPVITICDYNNTMVSVLGGTFVFSPTPNACNPAVNPASWGTIKSLYR